MRRPKLRLLWCCAVGMAWCGAAAWAQVTAPGVATAAAESALPGYLIVVGKTTDRTRIGAYAAALPPIYASLNAYYLAIGGPGRGVSWLEGPWRDRSLVVGRFTSRADVDAFWWGDAYRAAVRKRDNAGAFSVVALEGTAPVPFEGTDAAYLIVMTASDAAADGPSLSLRAAQALAAGVNNSGGVMMTSLEVNRFTPLEGDSVFDRIALAAWPSKTARAAYLASADARTAQALRQQAGLSAVAAADGVPRNQAPPAATPQSAAPPATPDTTSPSPSPSPTPTPTASSTPAAARDLGARAFLQCRSCHNLKPGQPDTVGPNLAGSIGARFGANRPAFNYSDAAKASMIVWTDATLDRWLENPAAVVPGSKMAFAGIKSADARTALIEFLKRETR
jgi:cytochrome c2/uncharacterized protein (DUF1330 family)